MHIVLTRSELEQKGITRRDVARMLARAEKLCNWHAKRHTLHGTTPAQGREWDAACARWDHLKAIMEALTQ